MLHSSFDLNLFSCKRDLEITDVIYFPSDIFSSYGHLNVVFLSSCDSERSHRDTWQVQFSYSLKLVNNLKDI